LERETRIELATFSLEGWGRYLVSGSDGIVTGCGFSQAYDDAAAADWASAFGG